MLTSSLRAREDTQESPLSRLSRLCTSPQSTAVKNPTLRYFLILGIPRNHQNHQESSSRPGPDYHFREQSFITFAQNDHLCHFCPESSLLRTFGRFSALLAIQGAYLGTF